ncbi:glycerol kinase GlpK [Nanoarchaeota archaeon]
MNPSKPKKRKKLVLALDLGTTGIRVILFDHEQNVVFKSYKEIKLYHPKSGWVEQDPNEILETTRILLDQVVKSGNKASQIVTIGITNQRETTIIWDKDTGEPVYNAIVWQCKRTAKLCQELKPKEDFVHKKTGLFIDPYFSATKIKWILDNVKGARKKAEKGKLMFGTVDTWILWNLANVHLTDVSNASRTSLFNIHTLEWDKELLDLFDVPRKILPSVNESGGEFGCLDKIFMGREIPINSVLGDQQAAMFAQGCYGKGIVKNTYGTGCFMLTNTGNKVIMSKNNLISTIAWKVDGKVEYALEGSIFMGGASVKWLRDNLEIIDHVEQTEKISFNMKGNGGVYFVPALVGLGAPHWDSNARGIIVGINRGTKKGHIIRATLEAIAYQSEELIKSMEADCGYKIKKLNVDGGATANNFLMQFQSDILDIKIERPKVIETTALGAAYLAGLSAGFWKDKDDLVKERKVGKVFKPKMKESERKKLLLNWKRAVNRSKNWEKS